MALADATARTGDRQRALGYLVQAEPLAEAGPAAFSYELAAVYAKTDPPLNDQVKQKVVKVMKRFHDGVCQGQYKTKYGEQCILASVWVMRYTP